MKIIIMTAIAVAVSSSAVNALELGNISAKDIVKMTQEAQIAVPESVRSITTKAAVPPAPPPAAVTPEKSAGQPARTLECVSYSKEYTLRIVIKSFSSDAVFSVLTSSAEGPYGLPIIKNLRMKPDQTDDSDWAGFEGVSGSEEKLQVIQLRILKSNLSDNSVRMSMAVSRKGSDILFADHELNCK
ncbi:MAG: hypothetical protein NTY45_13265 [Elusimicrobia bacterium]|nr:hypothetical protein [Elusimicrobiota bacterium]